VPYEKVREFQLNLLELRAKDLISDTVLFLEHEPVITRGRGLQFTGVPRPRHMPLMQSLPPGLSFAESERGGDLTYHGPGQLVVYPICKLDGSGFAPHHDIEAFLRKLEKALIDCLAKYGLNGSAKQNATGVWMGDKKVASVGIAIKKWVTYHGIAINCVNDLKPFYFISPCGFNPEVMTRLSDWVKLDSFWRDHMESSLAEILSGNLSAKIESLSLDAAVSHFFREN
jgi:lipoate-protein ligase B